VSDHLAAEILPKLLDALHGAQLTPVEQQAQQVLMGWSEQMTATSAGAAIWWTFWTNYLSAVFTPWWTSAKVPVHLDSGGLKVSPGQFGLDEDLEGWTLHDQHNAVFSPPSAGRAAAPRAAPGTAVTAMRSAFVTTVRQLVGTLHESPQGWTWGALHTRQFPSLTGAAALGYGPRAASGDLWTVDAAEGGFLASDIGPSWRMIVAWSGSGKSFAEGIYPGGQSEDPASPWYSDLVAAWWAGTYLPMPAAGGSGVTVEAGSGTSGPTSVAAQASASQVAGSAAGAGPAASAVSSGSSASSASSDSLEAPPGLIVWELVP
jgi:penicillin amidase